MSISGGGVGDDVARFVLRIESAVWLAVILARVAADDGLLALRPDLRKARVLPDLDAPALIVGQVPVEAVYVVQGEHVDVCLDLLDGEEVARDVEVHAAVCESRRVGDRHGRHAALALRDAHGLAHGLYAVEYACGGGGGDGDAVGRDLHAVAFGVVGDGPEGEGHGRAFGAALGGSELKARLLADIFGKEAGIAAHGLVAGGIDYGGAVLEEEGFALRRRHLEGCGHDVVVGLGRP